MKNLFKRCKERNCHIVFLQLNLFLMVVIVVVIAFLALVPVKVYEIEAPYKTLKNEYRAGEAIEVRQVYCKLEEYPATVDISIVDGYIEALRTINSNSPIGCYDRVATSAVVPEYLAEGDYKLRYIFTVHVNPFRTETYTVETEMFKVVK